MEPDARSINAPQGISIGNTADLTGKVARKGSGDRSSSQKVAWPEKDYAERADHQKEGRHIQANIGSSMPLLIFAMTLVRPSSMLFPAHFTPDSV